MYDGAPVVLYLIVAEDGTSWTSEDAQAVWGAETQWCEGFYDIFKIDLTVFNGGVLHGTPYATVSRLVLTEHSKRELYGEEVKTDKEIIENARSSSDDDGQRSE